MVVQHNMLSMIGQGKLSISETKRADAAEKLSTGYRMNRAADDAAGLSISEKLRWQIRGLNQASDNIIAGISLVKVADGALQESQAILQRMNELAVQAANDTNTELDRGAIQFEIDDLTEELDRIAETTSFNRDIYPLKGEGVSNTIRYPNTIQEVTLTITNDTGRDVVCNGKTYKDGEVMSLDGALWFDLPAYRRQMVGMTSWNRVTNTIENIGTSTKLGWYYYGFSNPTATLKNIFPMTGDDLLPDARYEYRFIYATLDDVHADDNGYLYAILPEYSATKRYYFAENTGRGLDLIADPNGSYEGTPTVEEAEKAGCIKAINGSTQNIDKIHIQSSSLGRQAIDIPLVDARAASLGVEYLDVMTHTYASKALDTIQKAINKVSEYRSTFGACQNRLEHAEANVDNTAENSTAAESRIRDTDIAKEMVSYSTSNIIAQAAESLLAQANQIPARILTLLE